MENGPFEDCVSCWKWCFSIAMLVYQRVNPDTSSFPVFLQFFINVQNMSIPHPESKKNAWYNTNRSLPVVLPAYGNLPRFFPRNSWKLFGGEEQKRPEDLEIFWDCGRMGCPQKMERPEGFFGWFSMIFQKVGELLVCFMVWKVDSSSKKNVV